MHATVIHTTFRLIGINEQFGTVVLELQFLSHCDVTLTVLISRLSSRQMNDNVWPVKDVQWYTPQYKIAARCGT